MVKVKCGAIIKEIKEGALKWYLMAGWKKVEDKKQAKEEKNDKANSEETASA